MSEKKTQSTESKKNVEKKNAVETETKASNFEEEFNKLSKEFDALVEASENKEPQIIYRTVTRTEDCTDKYFWGIGGVALTLLVGYGYNKYGNRDKDIEL